MSPFFIVHGWILSGQTSYTLKFAKRIEWMLSVISFITHTKEIIIIIINKEGGRNLLKMMDVYSIDCCSKLCTLSTYSSLNVN